MRGDHIKDGDVGLGVVIADGAVEGNPPNKRGYPRMRVKELAR